MSIFFFFQAEDGIRDLVRSRGLGDVYKRQVLLLMLGNWRAALIVSAAIPLSFLFALTGMVKFLSLIHI